MFKIIVDSLKTGILTEAQPFDVRPPFGFPVIDFPRCTLCEECARACPTGAIHTRAAGPGPADALALVRLLHSVPRMRRRVPGGGRLGRP